MDVLPFEVIVVGAGAAGSSCALILGRCRRRVAVFDSGEYRNASTHEMHGFLSRDGIAPAEFRRIAREQLSRYPSVTIFESVVRRARPVRDRFEVETERGDVFSARMLVLATGVVDELPKLPGIDDIYGTSAFHCPYCDGWEWRDRRLVVYGKPKQAFSLASELSIWSGDIAVCLDGAPAPPTAGRDSNLQVYEQRIERLESDAGHLRAIHFRGGGSIAADALFFSSVETQRSDLPAQLRCALTDAGLVRTDPLQASSVPGVYVVGNAARGLHLAIIAAAEGAAAAFAINEALLEGVTKQ